MKVFVVKFDWSTPDAEDVELFIYRHYDDAYDKFKEIIMGERNPEMSWVGDIEFGANLRILSALHAPSQ